jgi:hypothetical protein
MHIHTKNGAFSRLLHISSTVITITTIRNRIAKAASSVSFVHMAFVYPPFFVHYHRQDDCLAALLCFALGN